MSIKPQSFSKRLNAYFERYSTTTQILQGLVDGIEHIIGEIGLPCCVSQRDIVSREECVDAL